MELLKRLIFHPTELVSQVSAQVSSALHTPFTARLVVKSQAVVAGNEIKGILFAKGLPSYLKTVQITLKGSAKTQGMVSRLQWTTDSWSTSTTSTTAPFERTSSRTQHLATNYHTIINDTRTLYQVPNSRRGHHRPLITPQSRLPRTLGPGRRPKPVVSSPTYRFPFAIQVPQEAPSTHDDSANTAPSSISYSVAARVLSPLPKLPSSHSLPITVFESAHFSTGGDGRAVVTAHAPIMQQCTESKSTWSLREPGQVSATVTCPDASLLTCTTSSRALPQQLTLEVTIDNGSPRECTSVHATLFRRDACTVTHEMRTYPAEHVVALADAEIPIRVPAYAKGRAVRVVIPDVQAHGWTPSTLGRFDKVRVEYFVTVQVHLSVGTPLEIQLPVVVRVDVSDPSVWKMEREGGRVRLLAGRRSVTGVKSSM